MTSVIYIEEHDEHISRIIPLMVQSPPATPKYISKCADKVKREYDALKIGKHRTFGVADDYLAPPQNFLKKSEGFKPSRPTTARHRCSAERISIPKLEPLPPKKPPVNYRLKNIKTVEEMKPRLRERMVVVTCKGDRKKVEGSGQVPEYCRRDTYGRVPVYMNVLNCERKRVDEARKKKAVDRSEMCQLIPNEQRLELLEGLKEHWAQVTSIYQRLPLLPDGRAKVNRKEALEATLTKLENDIALLEGNRYIYVYKDDDLKDITIDKDGAVKRKEKGN